MIAAVALLGLVACKPKSDFEPEVAFLSPTENGSFAGAALKVSLKVEDFLILNKTASLRAPTTLAIPLLMLVDVAEAHGEDEEGQPKGFVKLQLDVTAPFEIDDTQYVMSNVAGGSHTLTAELVYEDGDSLEPPVTASVDFTVN